MDRLRKFWMVGACQKPVSGKGQGSSHSLDIVNFTSAYILLIVGVALAILLLLAEHLYFTFCRRKLRKVDKCGCCSLLSLVSVTLFLSKWGKPTFRPKVGFDFMLFFTPSPKGCIIAESLTRQNNKLNSYLIFNRNNLH